MWVRLLGPVNFGPIAENNPRCIVSIPSDSDYLYCTGTALRRFFRMPISGANVGVGEDYIGVSNRYGGVTSLVLSATYHQGEVWCLTDDNDIGILDLATGNVVIKHTLLGLGVFETTMTEITSSGDALYAVGNDRAILFQIRDAEINVLIEGISVGSRTFAPNHIAVPIDGEPVVVENIPRARAYTKVKFYFQPPPGYGDIDVDLFADTPFRIN